MAMALQVEPRHIQLGRVPRVVQVCVCGAILIRGVFRSRVRYFWTYVDTRPRPDSPRAFRCEENAGVHCGRDLCRPPVYLLGCDLEEMQRQGYFREPGWWRSAVNA